MATDSLIVNSETPDLEDLDPDSLNVPDTPDQEIYWKKSWDDKPDSSWESDSVSTAAPESPLTELDLFPTVVPETPATKRQRRRPVEEEEWFKSLLVMLLPGMADLL